jgi:hypothetical protein
VIKSKFHQSRLPSSRLSFYPKDPSVEVKPMLERFMLKQPYTSTIRRRLYVVLAGFNFLEVEGPKATCGND